MSSVDVCAVIYAPGADPVAGEVIAAAGAQTSPPRAVLAGPGLVGFSSGVRAFAVGPRESLFAAAVRAGGATGSRWLWLLDGQAVPRPGALEALLDAHEVASPPAPVMLASKVLDAEGRLHPDSLPKHEILEKTHSVDAAERHLVHLRAAAHGSVLVDRGAAMRLPPPRSHLPAGLDMHEWSARMLRSWDDTGYLVPASLAVRAAPPAAPSQRHWMGRIRVLGSSAWGPSEKLREAFDLGQDAVAAIRGQGREGVGAPGLSPSRRPRRMIGITEGANRL